MKWIIRSFEKNTVVRYLKHGDAKQFGSLNFTPLKKDAFQFDCPEKAADLLYAYSLYASKRWALVVIMGHYDHWVKHQKSAFGMELEVLPAM